MKYIGLSCIKQWLHGKRHCKETDVVNSYIWKNLECELCKAPFKDMVESRKGHKINLLNFQLFENSQNYMIIESVTNTTSKTIHVVNFDASPLIKVGRAQIAEVRITDISVSRHHSTFKLCRDGSVSLNDNYSKFGTLLLLNKPLAIIPSAEGTYIQIGRTMLTLQSQNHTSLLQKFTCCRSICRPKPKREEGNPVHFEESSKYFPQEFSAMFVPGSLELIPKAGKGLVKGDKDFSLEHGELRTKELIEQTPALQQTVLGLAVNRIQE